MVRSLGQSQSVLTLTASFRLGKIKLLEGLLLSLPLLEELPLLSRGTKGLIGGMRGDVGTLSMLVTDACRLRVGFLVVSGGGLSVDGAGPASTVFDDRALLVDDGKDGGHAGDGNWNSCVGLR